MDVITMLGLGREGALSARVRKRCIVGSDGKAWKTGEERTAVLGSVRVQWRAEGGEAARATGEALRPGARGGTLGADG